MRQLAFLWLLCVPFLLIACTQSHLTPDIPPTLQPPTPTVVPILAQHRLQSFPDHEELAITTLAENPRSFSRGAKVLLIGCYTGYGISSVEVAVSHRAFWGSQDYVVLVRGLPRQLRETCYAFPLTFIRQQKMCFNGVMRGNDCSGRLQDPTYVFGKSIGLSSVELDRDELGRMLAR